jgi:hypothetical protein
VKTFVNTIRLLAITVVTVLFSVQAFAQQPASQQQAPPPRPEMPELSVSPPPPVTKANTPEPKPAQKAILDLFQKYEVVGMSVDHGEKDLDDFIFALIRNPEFPNRVNDIAVECGNSLYQPILDRYIAGEDVPLAEVRPVWRNTTQFQSCGLQSFYEEFFPLVRLINKNLPPEKKLRVLAGDSPIDWSKIKTREDLKQYGGGDRNKSIASVMEKEVLSRHRKALMLFGTFHLFHGMEGTAVATYEKDYPNVTYIIHDHQGFGRGVPSAEKYNDELEKRMASWLVPSLLTIKGTWLADMDFAYFFTPIFLRGADGLMHVGFPLGISSISKAVDGFLYLGPGDFLLSERMTARACMDQDYIAELWRRGAIMSNGGGPNPLDDTLTLCRVKVSDGGSH